MTRRTPYLSGNPFLAWTELAWKLGEMSLASAEVIAHRTMRMAAAGPVPGARDRKEFTRMGTEKIEAMTESAQAMGAHATTNLNFGASAFRQWATGTSALMALASSRSPAQFIARQAALGDAVWRSAVTASKLSDSTARLAGRSLKPIHARATANARRLGRR